MKTHVSRFWIWVISATKIATKDQHYHSNMANALAMHLHRWPIACEFMEAVQSVTVVKRLAQFHQSYVESRNTTG